MRTFIAIGIFTIFKHFEITLPWYTTLAMIVYLIVCVAQDFSELDK